MTKQEMIEVIYDKIAYNPIRIGNVIEVMDVILTNMYRNNSVFVGSETYKEILNSEYIKLLWMWEQKRKPIEYQSDNCIEYVYNLIKQ